MKLSGYIQLLQDALAKHGDHEVVTSDVRTNTFNAVRRCAPTPYLQEMRKKTKRELYDKVVTHGFDGIGAGTGEKVWRIG